MSRLRRFAITTCLALLESGCGGQVAAKPANICMQPSDRVIAMAGCDAVLQPLGETDPVKSAAAQAALGPNVIGWTLGEVPSSDKVRAQGAITDDMVARAPALLAEMAKYPNIKWVFVADELGWCDTRTCLYDYLPQLLYKARLARAAGKKVLISMQPGILTQYPDAVVDGINEVDGIVFDIYPSIPFAANFGNCKLNDNPYSSELHCAVERVRRMGFTGAIVYAAQGFKLTSDTDAWLHDQLVLQQETLRSAKTLGADAVVIFGCHRDAYLQRVVPNLVPLCGTNYESLVTPN